MNRQIAASSVWVMVIVAIAVLTYALADSDGFAALGLPAAFAAWLASGGRKPRTLPRAIINGLLAAIVGFAGVQSLREGVDVELFCNVLIMLLVVKMLDRARARDAAQLVSLSLFLGIGSILTSNTLVTAIGVVALSGGLLITTFRLQIAAALDAAGASADPVPARDVTRAVRALLPPVAGFIAVVSVIVFIIMPRGLGDTTFGAWGSAGLGRVVGFNDQITLGAGGLISVSPDPVLDLRVTDQFDASLGGLPGKHYYLRGAVLNTYRNGSWTHAPDESAPLAQGRSHRIDPKAPHILRGIGSPRRAGLQQTITIRALGDNESPLFAVWDPVRVSVERRVDLREVGDEKMLFIRSQSGRFSYTIDSLEPRQIRATTPVAADAGDVLPIDHPFSEAVTRLARDVLAEAGVTLVDGLVPRSAARNAADAFVAYFERGGFAYSLEAPPAPPGADPIEFFLFSSRLGHCEYFASAMAAMCHTVGVKARVVTGYVASEYNAATDHYLVRASDAHAWIEAEVAPRVWSTFDPTPSADFERIHEPAPTLASRLRALWDTIEFTWTRAVVAFDEDARSGLLGLEANQSRSLGESLANAFDRVRAAGPRVAVNAILTAIIVGAITYVLGIGVVELLARLARMRRRPRRERRAAMSPADAAMARLHRRLLAALATAGYPRPPSVPLARHIAQTGVESQLSPEAARSLQEIVSRLYRWSFAGAPTSTSDIPAVRRAASPALEGLARLRGRRPAS